MPISTRPQPGAREAEVKGSAQDERLICMLDFGFSEILLTSAIALVVLGPERLPKVARQVGNWMGRARLMARQLSEQLEREVNAEELLRQQIKSPLKHRPGHCAGLRADVSSGASRQSGEVPASELPRRRSRARRRSPGRCRDEHRDHGRAMHPDGAATTPADLSASDASHMSEPEGEPGGLAEGTLISHLLELRDRLLKAMLAVGDLLHSVRDVHEPAVHVRRRAAEEEASRRRDLIATSVVAPFTVPFKLALVLAIGIAMPFVLYQAWAFVAPGLYRHEKKLAVPLLDLEHPAVLPGRRVRLLRGVPGDAELFRRHDAGTACR